jgi:pectate lyase
LRFGQVHVFNVYFLNIGDYAVGSTDEGEVYVERSVFEGITHSPITTMVSTSMLSPGYVAEGTMANANIYVAPTAQTDNDITTIATFYPPPYTYTNALDLSGSVQPLVTQCAGSGTIDPLPIPTN